MAIDLKKTDLGKAAAGELSPAAAIPILVTEILNLQARLQLLEEPVKRPAKLPPRKRR